MKRLLTLILLTALPQLAVAEEIALPLALQELRDRNEDWRIVRERIEQARAMRRETRARLLPQLNAGASTSYNGEEVALGDRVVRPLVDWSVTGSASLTLFDGSVYPLVGQATRNLEIAELDAEWAERSLLFEVEAAYYELDAAQRDVDIATQTVALRQVYVDRATALEASGVALPLDVARATVQKLEAEQALIEAETRVGIAANALAVLLGREPTGALRAQPSVAAPTPPQTAAALSDRPDLEAGARAIDAAKSLETSRWWSLAPRLDLRSDLRYGPPSFTAPDGVVWSLTLGLSWLLYDGGARYARIQAAESHVREAELRQSQRERYARADIADALRTWQTAHRAITVAEQQVAVAKQAYEMTVARFDSGLATSIEVTEASDQLFRAESTLSNARLTTDIAAARYRYLSEAP